MLLPVRKASLTNLSPKLVHIYFEPDVNGPSSSKDEGQSHHLSRQLPHSPPWSYSISCWQFTAKSPSRKCPNCLQFKIATSTRCFPLPFGHLQLVTGGVGKPSLLASRRDNSIQSSLWNQPRPLCWLFSCSILLVLISTDIDPKDIPPINFLPSTVFPFPGIWFRAASARTDLRRLTLRRILELDDLLVSLRTRRGHVKSPGHAKAQLWKVHSYDPGRDILKGMLQECSVTRTWEIQIWLQ